MGLFDTIWFEYKLPESIAHLQHNGFQTKDLLCAMDDLVVGEDGMLYDKVWDYEEIPPEERHTNILNFAPTHRRCQTYNLKPYMYGENPAFHGYIYCYEFVDGIWVDLRLKFTDGKLETLTILDKH